MKMLRRWALAGSLIAIAAMAFQPVAAGSIAELTQLRVANNGTDAPQVILQADGDIEFESFVLDGPDRLVLDLTGVICRLDQYKFQIDGGGVVRARAAQHQLEPEPVTRVVFDLTRPVDYRIDGSEGGLKIRFGTDPSVAMGTPSGQPTYSALEETISAPEKTTEPVLTLVENNEPVVTERTVPVNSDSLKAIVDDLERRVQTGEEPVEAKTVEQKQIAPTKVVAETPTPKRVVSSAPPEAATAEPVSTATERIDMDRIDQLLQAPAFASPTPQPRAQENIPSSFESQTIVTDAVTYSGRSISLNFVDADIKQIFRLFHEISGINFVLDPGVTGRVTIVLDSVPWDQALDIILKNNGLDKVLENNVLRIATTERLAQEAASRRALREAKELEVEPITLTRTLSYAKAIDVERVIREGGVLTQRGRVIVDERTNTLIISDVPKRVEPLDVLISTLDAETPQVMIEARIVETTRRFSQDFGVDWGFSAIADNSRGTGTGLEFPNNASTRYDLSLPGEGGAAANSLGFSFGNILDSFTLDLALTAIEDQGEGRVLSAPKIATQNNERAEIEQGLRIPVVNTTATEIDVQFVSASLRLVVTPQITAEGTIILDVEVENNSADFTQAAADIPSIQTQRAQTKVMISDGGTTVIGGIFTVNEGSSEAGVPWFRKLPVFGWLFKRTNLTVNNRELLIFITPKIVNLG